MTSKENLRVNHVLHIEVCLFSYFNPLNSIRLILVFKVWVMSHFNLKLDSYQYFIWKIYVAHEYSIQKLTEHPKLNESELGSNFENQNEMNGILRTKSRKQVNFKGSFGSSLRNEIAILDSYKSFLMPFRIPYQCLVRIWIILSWNIELPFYTWFKWE